MTLDFTGKGRVVVKMSKYIKTMVKDAPVSMDRHAATPPPPPPPPAVTHLFKINMHNLKLLYKEMKELFVNLVMQGLFLSQRGRPDIRTAISFLCSCLNCPDEDNFKKLTRLLRYICIIPSTCAFCLAKTTLRECISGLMLHTLCTRICMGTQAQPCPWEMGRYTVAHRCKRWLQGVPQSLRWLASMMSSLKFYGRRNFWRIRG